MASVQYIDIICYFLGRKNGKVKPNHSQYLKSSVINVCYFILDFNVYFSVKYIIEYKCYL